VWLSPSGCVCLCCLCVPVLEIGGSVSAPGVLLCGSHPPGVCACAVCVCLCWGSVDLLVHLVCCCVALTLRLCVCLCCLCVPVLGIGGSVSAPGVLLCGSHPPCVCACAVCVCLCWGSVALLVHLVCCCVALTLRVCVPVLSACAYAHAVWCLGSAWWLCWCTWCVVVWLALDFDRPVTGRVLM